MSQTQNSDYYKHIDPETTGTWVKALIKLGIEPIVTSHMTRLYEALLDLGYIPDVYSQGTGIKLTARDADLFILYQQYKNTISFKEFISSTNQAGLMSVDNDTSGR